MAEQLAERLEGLHVSRPNPDGLAEDALDDNAHEQAADWLTVPDRRVRAERLEFVGEVDDGLAVLDPRSRNEPSFEVEPLVLHLGTEEFQPHWLDRRRLNREKHDGPRL